MDKKFWSERYHKCPLNIKIYGENLYAKHSIHYTNLKTYFEGFAAFDINTKVFLSYKDTAKLFRLLDIKYVPLLYSGIYDKDILKELEEKCLLNNMEGYVIRIMNSFSEKDFSKSIVKWVRPNHIQSDEHWVRNWIPNELGSKNV